MLFSPPENLPIMHLFSLLAQLPSSLRIYCQKDFPSLQASLNSLTILFMKLIPCLQTHVGTHLNNMVEDLVGTNQLF